MEWVWLSLLSTGICSAAVIVQKHCLDSRVHSVVTYGAWAGIAQALGAALFWQMEPPGELPSSWPVLLALLAGMVRALSLIAQYKGLQAEGEVSRAVPIIDSYPLFVAILATAFLGQNMTPIKWMAIAMVVAGSILVSQHRSLPGQSVRLGKSFVYLAGGSLGIATFVILAKLALESLSCGQVFALSSLGGAPLLILAGVSSGARGEISSLVKRPRALGMILLGETLLALSIIVYFRAITLGPISLVSAITATRPLMVLIYSTLLTVTAPRFISEQLSRPVIWHKLLATTMVTAGIAMMSLVR